MRAAVVTLAAVLAIGASSALADPNCTCRAANGVEATLGETICLKTPSGLRLARCEMVLNNTSWKFLPGACPQASRETDSPVMAAMSVAPQTPPLLR
jgi:hypothetical protein